RGHRLPAACNERGLIYAKISDHDRAIADFSETIRLEPDDPAGYVNRGGSRLFTGDFDGAIADYSEAIRLNHPELAVLYSNRGNAHAWKQHFDQAIADYTEAL